MRELAAAVGPCYAPAMVEKIELTPARFAVYLIANGCLPLIFNPDAITGQLPVEGHTLTADERKLVGLNAPGTTIGYRIGDSDVFFDMAGDNATIWFAGGDFATAARLLADTLRMSFGDGEVVTRSLETDKQAPRTMEIEIRPAASTRAALLSVTSGRVRAQGDAQMFFCRIYPQQRMAS